jgi:SPP1 family predicted phage head-tail adaptor
MQAGWLRHRITITDKQITRRDNGEEAISWADHFSAWASIEPLRGREYLESKQIEADVDTRIRLRHQPDKQPLPRMRIAFGSRTFEIVSVVNVKEKGAELNLMCKELIDEVIADGESI